MRRADSIVICNGFAQALRLVVQVIRDRGGRRIAGEDPGFQDLRLAAEDHGLEVVPIPVDEAGLDVAALARTKVDAVVVTPAHHFPTGPSCRPSGGPHSSPGRRTAAP